MKVLERNIQALSGKQYDVVVVGAGIFGLCTAWDAALRGLSVAIIDKGDFSHASSANHFRMVHGGIRYLQHGDVKRIRESSHERTALLRIAPHLVHPLPIAIPTYGHGMKGKEFLYIGFSLYDLLTFDRNRGISDPQRRIPCGRFLSKQEILESFPSLDEKGLTGAALFYDGQIYNPTRLGISFLRSAVNAGADSANYMEAVKYIREENTINGVIAKDLLNGNEIKISGQVVINTAGSWSHRLLEKELSLKLDPMPVYSRDLAFVVSRSLTGKYGFATTLKSNDVDTLFDRGGRHIFIVPWRGKTLVGVWHEIFDEPQENLSVTQKELQGFVDEVNAAYTGFSLTVDDISMILMGLTLFGEKSKQETGEMSFGKRSKLIDHKTEHQVDGLITLLGVRATTSRGMAEKAIDLVFEKLGKNIIDSRTAFTPIYGGDIKCFDEYLKKAILDVHNSLSETAMRALIHNYGSQYESVLKYADENPLLTKKLGDTAVTGAEVVHAVREEMALKLEDVVFRRTDLGTGGDPGDEAIEICAQLVKKELDWDEERTERELNEVKNIFKRIGFLNERSI